MTKKICVLVVGHHAVERKGLVSLLGMSRSLSVVGEAASGDEAITMARAAHPQVILMDQKVLQKEGPGSIWRMWRENHAAVILIVGSDDELPPAGAEIDTGTVGFIDWRAPVEELVHRIRSVVGSTSGAAAPVP